MTTLTPLPKLTPNTELLTERHLQALWLEQKYLRGPLFTLTGENIRVLSPGIWNNEAGPDFLKAHIEIGNKNLRGDVEIHIVNDGWEQHGHHLDNRYQQVILHVYLTHKESIEGRCGDYGRNPIPQLCLSDYLTVPVKRLVQLLDLDLYPSPRCAEQGDCALALFRKISPRSRERIFKMAALQRLEEKAAFLESNALEGDSSLLPGIIMALGYKANSRNFLNLYHLLGKERKCYSETQLLASLLGSCGLLNKPKDQWKESEFFMELCKLWKHTPLIPKGQPIQTHSIRPLNHPIRRLAIVAKLLAESALASIEVEVLKTWKAYWSKLNKKPSQLKAMLIACLPSYEDSYWESHQSFEPEGQSSKKRSLMGAEVKAQILINSCLPLIYRQIQLSAEPGEQAAFWSFYHQLRLPNSQKKRYLEQRFFGEGGSGYFSKDACLQQGAFQVHKHYCTHYEASCSGCPFVSHARAFLHI